MALSVWPGDILPLLDSYAHTEAREVAVLRFGRGQYEQRMARDGGPFRGYAMTFRVSRVSGKRERIDAFLRSVGYEATSFLWRDPLDYQRFAVTIGASVAAQTVFSLPTTGDARGDYPIDSAGTVLRDDGAVIARTVQTDDRTLTASGGAPGAASAMTCDLAFYKRVRLSGGAEWSVLGGGSAYETSLRFVEVPA